jgi:hypothetical protein
MIIVVVVVVHSNVVKIRMDAREGYAAELGTLSCSYMVKVSKFGISELECI